MFINPNNTFGAIPIAVAGLSYPHWKLPKYVIQNAVEASWMMVQARSYMDVASEPLSYFDWSMRHVLNACNFAGAS
ncbi:hypothetical protein GCM10007978_04540 [Shewanella hanedai]|uniref:Uncharacterized protein n=1 Tax=Shewanella hanedai TaxID=25 RepID=A0A553JTV4_SHEHA|nr:hypothetical protein [Shewanella hanedai]TRY15887.1 hypothetical protein FN961_02590 [Shewanella hanedai]GGI69717.1 hypothetical protein GCM10007978_04540 [Shewanella hanedai]